RTCRTFLGRTHPCAVERTGTDTVAAIPCQIERALLVGRHPPTISIPLHRPCCLLSARSGHRPLALEATTSDLPLRRAKLPRFFRAPQKSGKLEPQSKRSDWTALAGTDRTAVE